MKKGIAWMCIGVATACFSGVAGAEMFKCTKDGRTTFQEQPCGQQGGAETKLQSSKPSAWIGCYLARFSSGVATPAEILEVRQEGDAVHMMPVGRDGKNDARMIMKPASPSDLRSLKENMLGKAFKGEITSGLAVYGARDGQQVIAVDADRGLRMGFYWVHAAGEEESLYAFFPFTLDKTKKVPCPAKK